jgi:VanZ family protein
MGLDAIYSLLRVLRSTDGTAEPSNCAEHCTEQLRGVSIKSGIHVCDVSRCRLAYGADGDNMVILQVILQVLARFWYVACSLWLLSITVLSLNPLPELPVQVPGSDKTHHFIAYGILALPVALRRPRYWWLCLLFFAVYSGVIELIQPYVNRHGEWADFFANLGGLCLGTGLGLLLRWVAPHDGAGVLRSQVTNIDEVAEATAEPGQGVASGTEPRPSQQPGSS